MGKFIILIFIAFGLQGQSAIVKHYQDYSEYIFYGNDSQRILIHCDTTNTQLIYSDFINFKFHYYENEMLCEAIEINKPKFKLRFKQKSRNTLKYTYKLDPLWPHRTLLVIYDCYSLQPCFYN